MYLLIEYSYSMNIVASLVYWLAIHKVIIEKYSEIDQLMVFTQISLATAPLLCSLGNVILSNFSIEARHVWITAVVNGAFLIVNFILAKINNAVYYPFLPWNSFKSIVIVPIGMIVAFGLMYFLNACLLNKLPKSKATESDSYQKVIN